MHRTAAQRTQKRSKSITSRATVASVEMLETRRLLAGGPGRPGKAAPADNHDQVMIDYGGIGNPMAYQIGGRWVNTASGGTGSTGTGITLTYSIVPDGLQISGGVNEPASPSVFKARMNAIYGNEATWLPIVHSVFESWSAVSGITYIYQATDDGAFWGAGGQLGVRGDVRMSSHPIDGAFNILAYNFFPSGGGDMVLDSQDLQAGGFMFNQANGSRALRNVMAHEHGHGMGFNHVDPINNTKLMEAFASTAFDGPQYDDMLAVQRNYGDFYEKAGGNNTVATATNRGSLTNGQDIVQKMAASTTGDLDYFRFDIASSQNVTVNVTPFGPAPYLQGPQGGATSSFNGVSQANLEVSLFASDGITQLAIANTNAIGLAETINGLNLGAGTYYIRVRMTPGSPNAVQSYTLTTTVANAQASAVIAAVSPDPRTTTVSSIAINFNEAVNGFDIGDLTLTRDGFSESLGGASLNTANNINFTLNGLDSITNRVGQYTLTLNAAGSGITTQNGGNPIVNNATDTWLMTAHVGTSADEVIRIVPNGALTNVFINNDTATPDYSYTASQISLLTVDGGAGDDTMVVDFAGGSALPPVNGMNFIGGSHVNGDTLRVVGEQTSDTFQMNSTSITRSSPFSPSITVSGAEIYNVQTGTYSAFSDMNKGLISTAATVVLSASQHMLLTTVNSGTVRLTTSGDRVLVTGALTINGTGRLDLFNNALVVDYTGSSPINTVEGFITNARTGGTWLGNGLTSSNARVADPKNTGLGIIEASDYDSVYGAAEPFFGQTVDDSAVLVRFTYYGDTDFNFIVNFDDYSRTDTGFGLGSTGWFNGDFDLSDNVNFDDYSLIDLAFNTQEPV